jgi:AcrR family transcriptional regulator
MPKRVDVVERREELVAAVLAVIAERGVEALTVRTVAQQAGVSAGLLHHYFPGGRTELLQATVTTAVARGQGRMMAVLDAKSGLAAVRAVALELLPVTPERRLEWSAWVTLWGQILTVGDALTEQRERLDAWRVLLSTLLGQAVEAGDLPAGVDTAQTALRLAALLDGLGLHAMISPDLLTPERIVGHVDGFLATVRP